MQGLSIVGCALLVLGLQAEQDGAPAKDTKSGAAMDTVTQLRKEADQLKKGHASHFFEALIEAIESGDRKAISDQLPPMLENYRDVKDNPLRAPALVQQADRAARAVLGFHLKQALAPGAKPPDLEEWRRLKARVVAHAEAIVLEGVLRPNEVRRWKPQASKPLAPQLPGRYSIIPIDYIDGHIPAEDTREAFCRSIYSRQFNENRSSVLFAILLGYRSVSPVPPPRPPAHETPFPGLIPDQVRVLEDVDLLARLVRRYWLVRDVEPPPRRDNDPDEVGKLPPTPAMEFRLSDRGLRVHASIVAHAEEMALGIVLEPEQFEKAKIELWRRRGVHALLDPELAARLRLSSAQRNELAEALSNRVEVYHWAVRSVVANFINIPYATGPVNEVKRLERQFYEEKAQKIAQLDQPIWELLKPSQLRSLAGLLDRPVAGYAPPSTKPSRKLAVPNG
jgi:hypothetical protein